MIVYIEYKSSISSFFEASMVVYIEYKLSIYYGEYILHLV